jgi:hypothetical protein
MYAERFKVVKFFLAASNKYRVYQKRLVFEIQVGHVYSDLIVLICVEFMIRHKNAS